MPKTRPLEERFWEKVDIKGPDECWEWHAADNGRYGTIGAGPRTRYMLYAHRVSWEMANGPIPKGMEVLHHCDNPRCVNPKHLFLGTQADNIHDMITKGRRGIANRAHGENNGSSKLKEHEVKEIIGLLSAGYKQADIAYIYGVSQVAISCIQTGKTWRYLTRKVVQYKPKRMNEK